MILVSLTKSLWTNVEYKSAIVVRPPLIEVLNAIFFEVLTRHEYAAIHK
jgi:hypothetical protein